MYIDEKQRIHIRSYPWFTATREKGVFVADSERILQYLLLSSSPVDDCRPAREALNAPRDDRVAPVANNAFLQTPLRLIEPPHLSCHGPTSLLVQLFQA